MNTYTVPFTYSEQGSINLVAHSRKAAERALGQLLDESGYITPDVSNKRDFTIGKAQPTYAYDPKDIVVVGEITDEPNHPFGEDDQVRIVEHVETPFQNAYKVESLTGLITGLIRESDIQGLS